MPIYAVHAPEGAPVSAETAEQIALVREGFDKAAFLFGPFWLIANRLWRALAGWLVVIVAILIAAWLLRLPAPAVGGLNLIVALWLGLEAPALKAAALARRGFAVVDVAVAPDQEFAERAFFARWSGAPAPAQPAAPASPRGRAPQVLGLFPEPGGRP